MSNDFSSYNVIYIVYDRKNENHWSLLIIVTHYSLLVTHYLECKHAYKLYILYKIESLCSYAAGLNCLHDH